MNGKVAVITGGSSGIGLATAKRYVQEGAHVFIMARRTEELAAAAREIGQEVTAVEGDVTCLADLDRLYEAVKAKGKLDVVVAAAGFAAPELIEALTDSSFARTIDVNLRGTVFLVQKALPLMREGGSIVVIASITGFMGVPGYSAYSASKAALRSLTRTWTAELSRRGIRANTISPGPIDTPMIDHERTPEQAQQVRSMFTSLVPFGRLGRPEEVANVALFLGSDESSFVAGAEYTVDGGMGAV